MAKLSRDDLIDQIEDEFNSREWDLGDSGTYLDNLQAAVDSANEGDDSIDVREDVDDDYYYDWVDCYRDLFGQIADGLLQNELINWNNDNAVAKAIVDAVEYFEDDFHEIEDTWYDKKAQSIVDGWYDDYAEDADWHDWMDDDE